jgi:carbon-monoxide dehydrogenase catalytic subunit
LGECLDNARASGLFRALSDAIEAPLSSMPFAFASPEWSNEKGVGAALSFRLLGLNSYHCLGGPTFGSDIVERFLTRDTQELLGSVMVVEPNPQKLAHRLIDDLDHRRSCLGFSPAASRKTSP